MDKPQRGRPKGSKGGDLVRYQLRLPKEMYLSVQEIADREHSTYLETIRRLIKGGMFLHNIRSNPEAKLIVRAGDSEIEIVTI